MTYDSCDMRITSTRFTTPTLEGGRFDNATPTMPDAVTNATPDDVFLSRPKETVMGALLGSTSLGSTLFLTGGPIWGVAGAVIGGIAGGVVGNNLPQLSYDLKIRREYRKIKSESNRKNESYSEASELKPLEKQYRLANDPAGDIQRAFDGYDSSRNITGLLAKSGAENEPYRVAVEVAHLRPKAEEEHLSTQLSFKSGDQTLNLQIQNDETVLVGGKAVDSELVKVNHSVRFNQIIVELDKSLLRDIGWKDKAALELDAKTLNGSEVFDEVRADSNQKADGNLFRWEGKTIYQIVTDRFHNGDKTNDQNTFPDDPNRFHGGDWQGVINKLDYLEELGADVLWLSCPYENDRDFMGSDGYHGYWPHNFEKAEPGFGSKDKLKELVEKAHDKGMKVMLDVVVNHTGYNHPAARDPEFRDWFHREGSRNPFSQYQLERGSLGGLPDLAVEKEQVARHIIDVHKSWVEETDVDGFRVDAIRHVPSDFLREFDTTMREGRENFLSVGEVFWNDHHYLARYQKETQDTLFDFPLMQALKDVFGGNPDQSVKDRLKQFNNTREHNMGQAIMDLTKQGGSSMKKLSDVFSYDHAYENPRMLSTILDNHDTNRFLTHAGGDTSKLKLAAGFIFGIRGTPSVYYGTEAGLEGTMGSNRKDMIFDGNPELHDHFQSLIHLRKGSEALQLGTQTELLAEDEAYAFTRVLPGEEVVCAFNNADAEQTLRIPLKESQIGNDERLRSLTDDAEFTTRDGFLEVTLPAKGFAYLDWAK
jgi:alpha-amylase